jgi:hypothetical protein
MTTTRPASSEPRRRLASQTLVLTWAVMLLAGSDLVSVAAIAGPCRREQGFRDVATLSLNPSMLQFMQQVAFAKTAKLYPGPPQPEGIDQPAASYAVKVDWNKERAVFSLDDGKGHAGTLTLPTPEEITTAEIDTRDQPAKATGAVLYKEWTLTGKASATGAFAAANDPNQRLSLTLQGHGDTCITGPDEFHYWTLVMDGPKASYILFGDLAH